MLSRQTVGRTKPWRRQTRERRWRGARSSWFLVMDRRSKEGRGLGQEVVGVCTQRRGSAYGPVNRS